MAEGEQVALVDVRSLPQVPMMLLMRGAIAAIDGRPARRVESLALLLAVLNDLPPDAS
jgi:hypothetical protein